MPKRHQRYIKANRTLSCAMSSEEKKQRIKELRKKTYEELLFQMKWVKNNNDPSDLRDYAKDVKSLGDAVKLFESLGKELEEAARNFRQAANKIKSEFRDLN